MQSGRPAVLLPIRKQWRGLCSLYPRVVLALIVPPMLVRLIFLGSVGLSASSRYIHASRCRLCPKVDSEPRAWYGWDLGESCASSPFRKASLGALSLSFFLHLWTTRMHYTGASVFYFLWADSAVSRTGLLVHIEADVAYVMN